MCPSTLPKTAKAAKAVTGLKALKVVELLSTLCRDTREFRDCRHTFLSLPPLSHCRGLGGATVDRQVSVTTTALEGSSTFIVEGGIQISMPSS